MSKMVKVYCNRLPLKSVLTRQPKQPGQKKAEWNMPPETTTMPREIRWANLTKGGAARCTHCGHVGHDEVGGY